MQAVESMDPSDLYQAARDGYREWQAEQEDDDDEDEQAAMDREMELRAGFWCG